MNDNSDQSYYPQTLSSHDNTEFGEAFYFYLNRDNFGDTLDNNLSVDTSNILSLEDVDKALKLKEELGEFQNSDNFPSY